MSAYNNALVARILPLLANGQMMTAQDIASQLDEPVGEISLLLHNDDHFYDVVGRDGQIEYGAEGAGVTLESVADRLRAARGQLSQPEFASLLGVSHSTLSNYERNVRPPTAQVLTKLESLGFSSGWILTGKSTAEQARGEERARQKAQQIRSREPCGLARWPSKPSGVADHIGDAAADLAAIQLEATEGDASLATLADLAAAAELLRTAQVRELKRQLPQTH